MSGGRIRPEQSSHNILILYPSYSFPPRILTSLLRDLLLARRRSFKLDAQACLVEVQPPLQVGGTQHIPLTGPCVITFNHYHRLGFNAIWMAAAIASVVPTEMHFVMTGELTYPGRWYAPLGMFLSKIALHRAACIYGFTTMPPMPPRPKDVEARAASVRRVLELARGRELIIGLAPEGGDQPGGVLTMPASGAGRFCLLLHGLGYRFVPAGVYEEDGALHLDFGASFGLDVSRSYPADERDALAARQVMSRIAPLLPPRLRGEFG